MGHAGMPPHDRKQLPYAIRLAVDLLVQVLAATAQWLDTQRRSKLIDQSIDVRTRLMRSMVDDEDVLRSIIDDAAALCATLAAEAMVVCQHGRILVHGDIDQAAASAIIASLRDCTEELVVRHDRPRVARQRQRPEPQVGWHAGVFARSVRLRLAGAPAFRADRVDTLGRPARKDHHHRSAGVAPAVMVLPRMRSIPVWALWTGWRYFTSAMPLHQSIGVGARALRPVQAGCA